MLLRGESHARVLPPILPFSYHDLKQWMCLGERIGRLPTASIRLRDELIKLVSRSDGVHSAKITILQRRRGELWPPSTRSPCVPHVPPNPTDCRQSSRPCGSRRPRCTRPTGS